MRLMDGLMAIPSILLAIGIIAITRASVRGVLLAIAIPEIPRVVRLVQGVVLTLREQPYVEPPAGWEAACLRILSPPPPAQHAGAAHRAGHVHLRGRDPDRGGLGLPRRRHAARDSVWGNIMAEGRTNFQVGPWMILFPERSCARRRPGGEPGGDGLRDLLDPRFARRL